ncbi:MAG: DUF1330 domain-containing protein [Sedimentisphaerales bacterium]|nr:DUF1330 domain-containing protein [Sedimentisphaerales bacterium]
MAAYVIARVEVTDRQQYKKYLELTPATIAKYSGRFIARGGKTISLEGPEESRRVVILEFPSLERAEQWYHSDEYQSARKQRIGAAEADFLAIDGV